MKKMEGREERKKKGKKRMIEVDISDPKILERNMKKRKRKERKEELRERQVAGRKDR